MSKFTSILTAAVALTALSSATFATPVLTLTEKIVARRAVGSTVKLQTVSGSDYNETSPGNAAGAWDFQVEVDATISNLDAGDSFGSLAMDITTSGASVTHPTTSVYTWKAQNPTWADDGGDPAVAVFQIAGDKGASASDLAGILAVVDTSAAEDSSGTFGGDSGDPRLGLLTTNGLTGFKGPFNLGTFVVTYDGTSNATLNFANVQFAELNDSNQILGATITNASNPGSVVLNGASFEGAVSTGTGPNTPEPASLGVLAIGGAALLARRNKKA